MTTTRKATDEATNRFVFNKTNLDKIPFAEAGKQVFYYDTKTQGFGIRAGATTKTYILYARVKNGKPVRVSLGKHGVMTVDEAREEAIKQLNNLNQGNNPNERKKFIKAEKDLENKKDIQTVQWLLNKYKTEQIEKKDKKGKGGSAGTLRSLADTILYFGKRNLTLLKQDKKTKIWSVDKEVELDDWLQRPFRSITTQEILERFKIYSVAKPARCKVLKPIGRTHQVAFRMLRSAYNHEIPRAFHLNKEDIIDNPLNILKTFGLWEESNKRKNFLDFDSLEFVNWWNAVKNYKYYDGLVSDYFLFSLVQGGRSIDIAPLKWEQIDFKKLVINYEFTKNDESYLFPITKFALEILERRKSLAGKSEYVFAYKLSDTKYVPQDCKHHFKMIGKTSGKLISHHDLRRTFGSAGRTCKLDDRILDYCLKHTINDVNVHYFMKEEPAIREGLQTIEDFFFRKLAELQTELDNKVAEKLNAIPEKVEAVA
jgi:integrase